MYLVERLSFTSIVGDLRDPTNPNYCALGLARDFRLSALGKRHQRDQMVHLLHSWKKASREQREARERSRKRRGRDLFSTRHRVRPSPFSANSAARDSLTSLLGRARTTPVILPSNSTRPSDLLAWHAGPAADRKSVV